MPWRGHNRGDYMTNNEIIQVVAACCEMEQMLDTLIDQNQELHERIAGLERQEEALMRRLGVKQEGSIVDLQIYRGKLQS